MTLRLRLALAILPALGVFAASLPAKDVWEGVGRIVAIGDVHGDHGQFVTMLRQADLIDQNDDWIGGKTHLVQAGDVPDRGPDTRKTLDLLIKLEKQARKAGGYVHPLMGNHEAMNIYGDLRYVDPREFAAFADKDSPKLRDKMYELHVKSVEADPPPEGPPAFDDAYRAKWDGEHPTGYFEHRRAWAVDGEYGRWIVDHNVVIKINDTLFMHGGIGPKFAEMSIRDMNRAAGVELRDFDKLRVGMVIDDQGPLWYRGLAQNPEEAETPHLETLLKVHDAKRIVVAHTVTDGTITPRFGGRVVMIDCGMSAVYGSRQAFLVIDEGDLWTIHRGTRLRLPLGGEELLPYYKAAAKLDPEPSPLNALIATIEASRAAAESQ